MSLFRKPKKNIQRRVFSEQNDDDDEEPMEVDVRPREEAHKKEKKKDHKKQCLLSFETEEEGEVFQVKKSSHSKKMMRLYEKEKKRRENKDVKVKEEDETGGANDKTKEIITDGLRVVVNHKVPSPPPPPLILSGRDALCAGKNDLSSEEDESPVKHRFSKPDNFKSVLESGAIPDAAMIHAARKKRQRARELGDYIPVEDEEVEDKGRLMREDENDGSDEERIDMGANPIKRDQERRREQFYDAQESDQELNEWEDQQIRKGVTGATLNQELVYNEYNVNLLQSQTQYQQQMMPTKIEPGVPRTPEAILEKLREHYDNAVKSRESHRQQLAQVQRDLITAAEDLETLKLNAPRAADKFRFYQELRGYITDLVECLDEKVGKISGLEQKAIDQMAKKSEWLIERRRQDVRDQADEVTSQGKRLQSQKGPEDEEKMRRAVEREGRRTRRRRARETSGEPRHVEGMSSDDEIPQQDTLYFDNEKEQTILEVKEVFEDVVDEFSSIASILIKFEQWRETDMMAYTEAYATLCLPKVVSPLVRLNLIFWDPLNESVDIEKLDWYRTLALYGLHDDETENSLSKDPDINLLPTLVEKVIVPKITQLVERCWDPLSSTQTLRLVGVAGRYIRKYPTLGPDSKALHVLFNAVLQKLKSALEHDVFVPIMPRLAETKNPFFQRQFASGLKLLRNITSWQGILNDNTLKELAITSLLNRYLLSAIKVCQLVDAVSKTQLVSLILPRIWLQGDKTHLQMFTNCVMNLAQQLDKDNPLHLESIEILTNILKSLRT